MLPKGLNGNQTRTNRMFLSYWLLLWFTWNKQIFARIRIHFIWKGIRCHTLDEINGKFLFVPHTVIYDTVTSIVKDRGAFIMNSGTEGKECHQHTDLQSELDRLWLFCNNSLLCSMEPHVLRTFKKSQSSDRNYTRICCQTAFWFSTTMHSLVLKWKWHGQLKN